MYSIWLYNMSVYKICVVYYVQELDLWVQVIKDSANMSTSKSATPKDDTLFRIPPFFYIHVLDQNTNVTRLEIGPKIYIRQDNER